MTYKIQNEAIYKQCEAAGVSPDRARAGVEKHDAGLDDKLAALETRMKRLYGPAGMNVDPDKHMQQLRADERTHAEQRFTKTFSEWSSAERVNRCRHTLQNMEVGFGSYRERPEYEVLMSF